MWGKFKNCELRIGDNEKIDLPNVKGRRAEIAESENHFLWGKRYKIVGRDEWFEENCFEFVMED